MTWADYIVDVLALLTFRYWMWPICLRERRRYVSAATVKYPALSERVRQLDGKLVFRPFAAHVGDACSSSIKPNQINLPLWRGRTWRISSFQSMVIGYRRPSPRSLGRAEISQFGQLVNWRRAA